MKRPVLKILTKVSDKGILLLLNERLNRNDFQIIRGEEHTSTIKLVMDETPDILILEADVEEQSPEMTAYLVRRVLPQLKIIVISRKSSGPSVHAAGQGVYYFRPTSDIYEIDQIIHAAAAEIKRMMKENI